MAKTMVLKADIRLGMLYSNNAAFFSDFWYFIMQFSYFNHDIMEFCLWVTDYN